ncbi:DMT family transporter [Ovoidimarina sediminis]|uniref:DMT family transporter n=1 Tax=Ovoidimarina sediminis TaxID=3079856 RepID=UPI0029065B79|nr:DMT family transporter [Rhodophyticola sp. MJ-SS7]MDU8942717.1 DMT family transporter [Rhodophyticola sp. MJ-SS7]
MQTDRPTLGIALMLGFCVVAPFADSLAKLIGDRVPILQLLVARFGIQAFLLYPLARRAGQPLWWTPRINRLVWARTALHILGIGMMFLALRYLPLADAIAIAFVMPFILLFLGWWLLRETVGGRRIGAALVGFIGTLMVIQPSFEAVGAPALLPLGVAVVFALFMLVTRRIARATDPIAMQATSGLMALALLLPPALLLAPFGVPELGFVEPPVTVAGLLVALGVLGTLGHLLMTWSLRFAPASTLAPMQYLEIPVAAVFGWLIFSDFPNGLALTGICVTVAAGLYVIERERRAARRTAPPSPPPAPPAV